MHRSLNCCVSQRHAIITPRLKKSALDPDDMKNIPTNIQLDVHVKNMERFVCRQITTSLERNDLILKKQSANRRSYSTETAVLKLVSDFHPLLTKVKFHCSFISIFRLRLTRLIILSLSTGYKMLSTFKARSSRGSNLSLKIVHIV